MKEIVRELIVEFSATDHERNRGELIVEFSATDHGRNRGGADRGVQCHSSWKKSWGS